MMFDFQALDSSEITFRECAVPLNIWLMDWTRCSNASRHWNGPTVAVVGGIPALLIAQLIRMCMMHCQLIVALHAMHCLVNAVSRQYAHCA